jgi:hypothetical protein
MTRNAKVVAELTWKWLYGTQWNSTIKNKYGSVLIRKQHPGDTTDTRTE